MGNDITLNDEGARFVEGVLRRRSVRTFNGLRPDGATMARLKTFAGKATEIRPGDPEFLGLFSRPVIIVTDDNCQSAADGSRPEKLGAYGMVKGTRCFAIGACDDGFGEQLAMGYTFERFVLDCTEAGLGTCWLGATFTRSRFQHYFNTCRQASISKMTVRVVSPVGHEAPRQRWGERILRRMSKSDSRKSFQELFHGIAPPPADMASKIVSGEIELADLGLDDLIAFALEMMRLAPSSVNSQPWRASVVSGDNMAHVTIHSEGKGGRFTLIDMGIGLMHFAETIRLGGRSFKSRLRLKRGDATIEMELR